MNNLPLARSVDIVVQETDKELLVYDLRIDKAYCLNETSALVFELCDGQKTVSQISDVMSQKLKSLVSEDLVLLTINDLNKNGLLEDPKETFQPLTSSTRREMIKRVGLASMIALPMISSIVAPDAAAAASTADVTCFSSCETGAECGTACPRCSTLTGRCNLDFAPCNNVGGPCTATGICQTSGVIGFCSVGFSTCNNVGGPCTATGTCSTFGSPVCLP